MSPPSLVSVAVSFALAATVTCASTAAAAPADLDTSFAGDGIAEVGAFARESGARLAVGSDDSVFVLYSNYAPCEPPFECPVDLGIARYDANGVRDASYGTGPGSLLPVREFTERTAFDLAVGPDGRAAVAAYDQNVGGVIVARFDTGGRLDGTFGSGGRAPAPLDTLRDTPVAVAVQADGKIVGAGEGRDDEGPRLVVQRYLTDGQLDPGFGTGGAVTVPLTTKSRPADMLLDPTGRITIAAPLCCKGSSGAPVPTEGVSVVRLLPDGRPDGGLGGTGAVLVPTPGAMGEVRAAALAPDGGLFLGVEEAAPPVESRLFTVDNVFKLRADGAPDTSFAGVGRLRLFDRVGPFFLNGLVADGQGRLVAVGAAEKGAVARLKRDGGIDRTFNNGVASPVEDGMPIAVGLQSNGRIIVLADSRGCCGVQGFMVAALEGGTSRVKCLGKRATIVGTAKQDEIVGTPRRDVIAALKGKDRVRALGGADLICGGRGRDTLLGGPGKDRVQQDPARRRSETRSASLAAVKISRALVDEMVAHAREELPNECCGMVGGKDGVATSIYRAHNKFESPLRFEIASDDLIRIVYTDIPERGEELMAVYHSHTKSPAYPSQTDVNAAEKTWPESIWLVISLEDPQIPDIKGYWLKDLTIVDAEITIT